MAKIVLRYPYRGWKTKEQVIPAGTYDDHDPLVMAHVAYLVETGHATLIDSEPIGVQNPSDLDVKIALIDDDIPDASQFNKAALKLMNDNQLSVNDFVGYEGQITVTQVREKISGDNANSN